MATGLIKPTLSSARKQVRTSVELLRVAVGTDDHARMCFGAMTLGTYVEKLCASPHADDRTIGQALYEALRTEGKDALMAALEGVNTTLLSHGNRYI